jgi:uncharacterized membrane protein YecN with MAPEG domain
MRILILYAPILALIFVLLSARTIRMRRTLRIGIGDGGEERMLRAMRVHSNFAEYVPLGLVLLFLVESQGAPAPLVHALCLCLLAGRLSHAFGVSRPKEDYRFRVFGMSMTFATIVTASGYLLYAFARNALA